MAIGIHIDGETDRFGDSSAVVTMKLTRKSTGASRHFWVSLVELEDGHGAAGFMQALVKAFTRFFLPDNFAEMKEEEQASEEEKAKEPAWKLLARVATHTSPCMAGALG